ncbi:hypothetical protein [Nocardioides sp. CER19]|uniref:hypothetical protein n=1 Tax=Nocardioides sp. CER19 TaxID=3038538 RepID=UPI002448FD22|nr:hypothetical protein [Nocardioides sp. CER19]MDH2413952.1 hypothetical protein [Nocardioides sp. CER19]
MRLLPAFAAIVSVLTSLALAGCGGGSDAGQPGEPTPAPATTRPSTSAPAEATLEQQVAPYCGDLTAALDRIPALNPSMKQIGNLKQALESVRPSMTGAAATEVESWYTTTTDLAVAAFAPDDDFTTKWADWTMGTKVAIEATCNP